MSPIRLRGIPHLCCKYASRSVLKSNCHSLSEYELLADPCSLLCYWTFLFLTKKNLTFYFKTNPSL